MQVSLKHKHETFTTNIISLGKYYRGILKYSRLLKTIVPKIISYKYLKNIHDFTITAEFLAILRNYFKSGIQVAEVSCQIRKVG